MGRPEEDEQEGKKLPDVISVSEAAAMKEVSRQAVYLAYDREEIKGYKSGRTLLLYRESVNAWKVNEGKQNAGKTPKGEQN